MKISPSCYNIPQNYQYKNAPAFGHHPDFDRLVTKRRICHSEYFRRENAPSGPQSFRDVVDLFKKVFTGNNEPKKMLIAGIANSEEPFSYLAVIKQLNPNKPIEDVLDLHIIDLQSKPDDNKVFDDSYTMDYIPLYAKNSFVYNPHPKIALYDYRVKDELVDFLCETYNNPLKSGWESRLQEANYPNDYFDIVSANNVLYYIPENQVIPTFDSLYNSVKTGGYIITEDDKYADESKNKNNLFRYAGGIFRKL